MRTLLCALVAAACVALPVLAQPKSEQKPEKKAENEPEKKADDPKVVTLKVNSEAKQLLQSLRDSCRVEYSKTGNPPKSLKDDVGVEDKERNGEKFSVTDTVYSTKKYGGLVAEPRVAADGFHFIKFEWASGYTEVRAYESMEDLRRAQTDFAWDGAAPKGDRNDPKGDHKAGKQWDALYIKGTKWTTRMNFGTEMWQTSEVVKVVGNKATVKVAFKIGAEGEWMPATEHEVERPLAPEGDVDEPAPGYKEIATGVEDIGEWPCEFTEYEMNGNRYKVYMHRELGLLMKMIKDGTVQVEVTEFINPK